MPRYVVQWRYKSGLGGPWQAGEVVELTAEAAAAVNVDSPGVLQAEGTAEAAQFAHRAQLTGSRPEPDNFGVMTRETFGAVVNPDDRSRPRRASRKSAKRSE